MLANIYEFRNLWHLLVRTNRPTQIRSHSEGERALKKTLRDGIISAYPVRQKAVLCMIGLKGRNMIEKNGIKIKNLMEGLVEMNLDSLMRMTSCCDCDMCRADILAYTLNHLPPKYVASTGGNIFVQVDSMTLQAQADIIAAIMKAITVIKNAPRHHGEQFFDHGG
jgi:competence protein ComFB